MHANDKHKFQDKKNASGEAQIGRGRYRGFKYIVMFTSFEKKKEKTLCKANTATLD